MTAEQFRASLSKELTSAISHMRSIVLYQRLSHPQVSLFCRVQSRDVVRSDDILATTGHFPRRNWRASGWIVRAHTMPSYIRGVHFVTYGVCIFLIIKGGKSARKARDVFRIKFAASVEYEFPPIRL